MAAERRTSRARGEDGQSVVEFLLVTPMMIGLILLLIRVNSAIQVSIVDQQYARAQALFVTMNHNTYPYLTLRVRSLDEQGFNQMMMGVSDNAAPNDGSKFVPEATVQSIGGRTAGGSDAPHEEPALRSKVRVRNTVTLCTQNTVVQGGKAFQPIIKLAGRDAKAVEATVLNEQTKFDYCHAPQGVYIP